MRIFLFVLVLLIARQHAIGQETDRTTAAVKTFVANIRMQYPEAAQEAGIEGTVMVQFDVDSVCRITNKRVLSGPGYGLNELALKVFDQKLEDQLISALSPCTPATLVFPVNFKLE